MERKQPDTKGSEESIGLMADEPDGREHRTDRPETENTDWLDDGDEDGFYDEGAEEDDYREKERISPRGYASGAVQRLKKEKGLSRRGTAVSVNAVSSACRKRKGVRMDPAVRRKKDRRGMGSMDAMERGAVLAGVLVLVFAVVTCTMYVDARMAARQVASFGEIGAGMQDIGVIGESGLMAMADAQEARRAMEEAARESMEQEPPAYQEKELDEGRTIKAEMHLSSIQKDLKIKFVNTETGRLIPNILFQVRVSAADNKSYVLKDEDMDGIIYQTGVPAGECTVTMEGSGAGKDCEISAKSASVTIKDRIEYKKVDVADEVKTEAEVNAAAEDTKKQNTVVESELKDTVTWTESTKTPAEGEASSGEDGYEEVPKDKIADPMTLTVRSGIKMHAAASATAPESVPGEIHQEQEQSQGEGQSREQAESQPQSEGQTQEQAESQPQSEGQTQEQAESQPQSEGQTQEQDGAVQEIKVSLDHTSLELQVGESFTLRAVTDPAGNHAVWTSSDSGIITVQDGIVTAAAPGKADIIITTGTGNTAVCSVTVSEAKAVRAAVVLKQQSAEMRVGNTLKLEAEVSGTEDRTLTWQSDNQSVAAVAADGTVTAVGQGTAMITAVWKGDSGITASCQVTVKESPESDRATKLKDQDGNQLYVKDAEGNYREAVYADYYTAEKFYKKTAQAERDQKEYKYTGWQTIDGRTYYFDANGNKVTGEQVIQGARYTFDSDGVLSASSGIMGIDVSKWNGSIDWNAVKNSGVSYVIIRCGYRGSSTGALIEDPRFRDNIKGASAAGLKVGIYFFSQAVNEVEAVEEASMVLGLIGGYRISYPVFLDVEASGGRGDNISKAVRTEVCRAFCQTIQNAGYTAGIYANTTWLNSYIDTKSLTNYKIWLAQYAAAPTYNATRYDIWQYSAKGSVAGIRGHVDLNISYLQ